MNMNIINSDTAVMRGVRTVLQSAAGLIVGLLLAVWNVPGVPETVHNYISNNVAQLALTVGLPSVVVAGLAAFGWNALRKNVPNI